MSVHRGEIHWVDFGLPKGSEQGGKRPALIIQNEIGNINSSTTIVAAITSKKKSQYAFHVDIKATESGLPVDSTVLLEQIQTISKDRLINMSGQLDYQKMLEIDNALKISLGLTD